MDERIASRKGLGMSTYPRKRNLGQVSSSLLLLLGIALANGTQSTRVDALITYQPVGAVVREAHFRVGKDQPLADGEMDSYYYDATDTKTLSIGRNASFRVRFQVYNDGAANREWQPQLEWATSGVAWSAVPSSLEAAPFSLFDTGQYANGETIATTDFGLGIGVGTPQAGYAYDTENPPNTAIIMSAGAHTEIEFNIQATSNAIFYKAYAFRLTDAGTPLDSTANVAVVSVRAGENPNSPHYLFSSAFEKCAGCHRLHTGASGRLSVAWPEEQACFLCHDGTGARTNVYLQFQKTFHHPLTATSGVHKYYVREGFIPPWNQSPRHVECGDCHASHRATSGMGSSTPGFGDLPGAVIGQWGVTVTNPTGSWDDVPVDSFSRTTPITQEYQLCLKCHSPYAYGSSPSTPPSSDFMETNMAQEFNVNNESYHWVEQDKTAASGYTPRTATPGRIMSFDPGSGMERDTPMNCTDCHSSDTDAESRGAHGSSNPFVLRGSWGQGEYGLCLQCHDSEVYGPPPEPYDPAGGPPVKTGFSSVEKPNLHRYHMSKSEVQNGCQSCHSAIPHGGRKRAMLVEHASAADPDPTPYNNGSQLVIQTWASPGGWAQDSCGNGGHCHAP